MPGFRARYTLWIDYIDAAGLGMNSSLQAGQSLGPSSGQTIQFNQAISPGSGTFNTADINSILAAMQTDLSTQMLASQTRIQAFSSGGG